MVMLLIIKGIANALTHTTYARFSQGKMMMTTHPTGIYVGCFVKVIRRRLRLELRGRVINYSPFVLQHP